MCTMFKFLKKNIKTNCGEETALGRAKLCMTKLSLARHSQHANEHISKCGATRCIALTYEENGNKFG